MALLQTVLSEPNQPATIYPALSFVDNEKSAPKTTEPSISKNIRQFWNILPGVLLLGTVICPILVTAFSALRILFWFIFIPIGAGVGAYLNTRLVEVKRIYTYSGILLLICGIILIVIGVLEYLQQDILLDFGVIVSAFIYGVNHVTVILHAVDNSAREFRGPVLRSLVYSQHVILLVAALILALMRDTKYRISHIVTLGLVYIILAILVLILNRSLVYNSFLSALKKSQNENDVRQDMLTIRKEPSQSGLVLDDLKEMKLMLDEDATFGCSIFTHGNLKPLLLVTGARILNGFLNNIWIILLTSLSIGIIETQTLELCIALFLKLVIGLIVIFVADRFGLNCFLYIAGIIWGVVLVIFFVSGNLLFVKAAEFSIVNLIAAVGYWIISLGIEAISYNQLSEAFPLNKRAASIAFVTLIEFVVHFVIWLVFIVKFAVGTLVVPLGVIVISACLLKVMPNTHGQTLRKAREMFNDVISRESLRRQNESAQIPLKGSIDLPS